MNHYHMYNKLMSTNLFLTFHHPPSPPSPSHFFFLFYLMMRLLSSRVRARMETRIVPGPPRGEVHVRGGHNLHIPCRPRARARGPSRRLEFSHHLPPTTHTTTGMWPYFLLTLVLMLILRCLPTVAVAVAVAVASE